MPGRDAALMSAATGTSTSPADGVCAAVGGLLGRAGRSDNPLVSGVRETAQGAGAFLRGGGDVAGAIARGLATPSGLVGALIETGWIATHVLTYPFGVRVEERQRADRGYRIEHLRPHQRGLLVSDIEAAGTPILMIHGLNSNRSIFRLMQRGLRSRGFNDLTTINYSALVADIRTVAGHLAEEVERIVAETGYERIHIIGHSMGGLIARYYVTRLGGDARVHTLVTLGTPHDGTLMAYAWPTQIGVQLRPDSALLQELSRPVRDCRTRFIAYWSDLDQLIFPQRNAALRHPDLRVRNIALHGAGHVTLPMLGSVVHGISNALADLEPDGSTKRPGAAPLCPRTGRRGGGLPVPP